MESANGKTNIPIEDSTDLLVLLPLLQRFTEVVAIYSAFLEHQEGTGPVSNRCLQEYLVYPRLYLVAILPLAFRDSGRELLYGYW